MADVSQQPKVSFLALRSLKLIYITLKNLVLSSTETYHSGNKIFNNLPSSLKSLMNAKAKFKVALKQYLNTHSFALLMNLY
jgi:hypothetical protein